MKWRSLDQQMRLYLISAAILILGLNSSLLIYLTAGNDYKSVLGYEIVGGKAYLTTPENSKKYVHDLKVMGGNAAVFADKFNRWFIGLWHGASLAVTIACIATFISLGFFLAARTSPSNAESNAHSHYIP